MDITSLKTIIDNMMKERLRAGMPFLGFLLCPVLTFILTEVYLYNPFTDMKRMPWCLNLLIYWLTAAILVMLTGRLRAALRIQTVFFLLAGLANYYVVNFRSHLSCPGIFFRQRRRHPLQIISAMPFLQGPALCCLVLEDCCWRSSYFLIE